MDAYSSAAPLRVVIVPWLAFGHMLPYLELAERLASRGHRVSYVSTPRNLARLPPPASRHFAPTQSRAWTVDLVAIPLPRVDGLAAPFAEFMAAACADVDMRPHWIIADVFHHWAAASAAEHKVPFAMLLPSAAVLLTARAPGVVPGRRYEKAQKALFFDNQGASGMSFRPCLAAVFLTNST